MKAIWQATWRMLVFVIGAVALSAPVAVVASKLGVRLEDPLPQLAMNGLTLGTAFAAGWLLLRLDRAPLTALGLPWVRGAAHARHVLAGVAAGALWLLATLLLGWLAGAVEPTAGGSTSPSAGGVAVAVTSLALNAAMQEILFRGYPWFAFESRVGPRSALAATSVLFVVLHLGAAAGSPLALLNLLLVGVLFGLIRRGFGNLWMVTGVHAAWNILLGPVLGLAVSGSDLGMAGWKVLQMAGPRWLSGGSFGLEGSLVTTASTVAALALVLAWRRFAPPAPAGQEPAPAGAAP